MLRTALSLLRPAMRLTRAPTQVLLFKKTPIKHDRSLARNGRLPYFHDLPKISFRSTHDFSRAYGAAETQSNDISSASYELQWFSERTIKWRGGELTFRLPVRKVTGDEVPLVDEWIVTEEDKLRIYRAPFFNRHDVLLQMLQANYAAFRSLAPKKPTFSIQAMGTGSGKTRLLTEWIMHVFAKYDEVIVPFLESNNNDTMAKQFLNALYYSSYRQYVILCFGDDIDESRQDLAQQKLICKAILERHRGAVVTLQGKSVTINEESALQMFGIPKYEVKQLLLLFMDLADEKFHEPQTVPFPDVTKQQTPRRLVFFHIDECQKYSAKNPSANPDLLYQLFDKAALAYQACRMVGVFPFWYATGTYLAGNVIALHDQTSQYSLISASLDNLLEMKYLTRICIQFFNYQLNSKYCQLDLNSQAPEMSEEVATCLVRNYLKTFGNPRAIEEFVELALTFVQPYLNTLSKQRDARAPSTMAQVDVAKFDGPLTAAMRARLGLNLTLRHVPAKDLELINIKAALCSPLTPDAKLPGFNESPKQLVASNFLSLWHRTEVAHYYTRPFFTFRADDLNTPLNLLKPQVEESEHWVPKHPSLATLVVEEQIGGILQFFNDEKGDVFEEAVAGTIYARYVVAAKDKHRVTVKDLFSDTASESSWTKELYEIMNAEVKLNGVVKLKKQTNPSVQEAVMASQVIAIDVTNTEYADILVPIIIKEETKILALQCKLHAQQPNTKQYKSNATTTLTSPAVIAWLGVAPTQKKAAIKNPLLLTVGNKKAVLVLAHDVVSPLFLVGTSFVPRNLQQNNNNRPNI